MSKRKLIKAPAWHAKVAEELAKDFTEINAMEMTTRKRRAYLGLKFIWVKEQGKADKSIPHGQFFAWLETNVPNIPRPTISDYMTEARSISEKMQWQISEFPIFEVPPHQLLANPDSVKTDKSREERQLLLDLVEGRGRFRPVTEYKQVEDDPSGEGPVRTARGNHSGKGNPKANRVAAAAAADKAAQKAFELEADSNANWLEFSADDEHIGRLAPESFAKLLKAVETARSYMLQRKTSRKELA
jgi:hypothetical protein